MKSLRTFGALTSFLVLLFAGASALAQNATTVQQGTDFAKGLAPRSAGQVVNPSGVSAQGWGNFVTTPSAVPTNLGAFSVPTTGSAAYDSAKTSGLTVLGVSAMTTCANFVPGQDADQYQTQSCAAVNFLNNSCLTPSTQQAAVMTRLGQSQPAGSNCAGTYGNSVRTFGFPDQLAATDPVFVAMNNLKTTAASQISTSCSIQPVQTDPSKYQLNTCVKNADVSAVSCSQYLNVTDKTTTSPAVEKYSCVGGVLSGQYCESIVTTAATQTYLCPAGSDLSDTSCISTDTSAATPVYSCSTGTLSGSTCTTQAVTTATWGLDCSIAKDLAAGTGISPTGYPYWGITPTNPTPPTAQAIPPGYCWLYANTAILQKLSQYSNVAVGSTYYSGVGSLPFITEFQGHSYSCPNGGTLSGTTCVTTATSTGTVSSYTCPTGTLVGSNCVTTTTSPATPGYSCLPGSQLTSTSCTTTSSVPASVSYSCSDGSPPVGAVCEVHSVATSWTDACSQYNGGPLPTP